MTNIPMDVMEELNAVDAIIDQADRRRQAELDMSVPVGSELGRGGIEAGGARATIVETKQDSLARTPNGAILPGRINVYYRLGGNSIRPVDTGRLAHHLSKRVNGQRVFSLTPFPDVSAPKVYEKTCQICLDGPEHIRKVFVENADGDGETKYIAHMTTFHGMQYQTILRQEERDERRNEQALLRDLVERLGSRTDSPTAVDVEALVQARLAEIRAQESAEQDKPVTSVTCDCGETFKNEAAVRMHKRFSKKHKEPVAV